MKCVDRVRLWALGRTQEFTLNQAWGASGAKSKTEISRILAGMAKTGELDFSWSEKRPDGKKEKLWFATGAVAVPETLPRVTADAKRLFQFIEALPAPLNRPGIAFTLAWEEKRFNRAWTILERHEALKKQKGTHKTVLVSANESAAERIISAAPAEADKRSNGSGQIAGRIEVGRGLAFW